MWSNRKLHVCGLSCFTRPCCYFVQSIFRAAFHHPCVCVRTCSFLCRAVAIDEQHRAALLSLPADAEIQLSSERASFFLVGSGHMTRPPISSLLSWS